MQKISPRHQFAFYSNAKRLRNGKFSNLTSLMIKMYENPFQWNTKITLKPSTSYIRWFLLCQVCNSFILRKICWMKLFVRRHGRWDFDEPSDFGCFLKYIKQYLEETKTREKTIVENVGSIINNIIWGAKQECSTRGGQFLPSQLFQHHQIYISNCNIDCSMHLLYPVWKRIQLPMQHLIWFDKTVWLSGWTKPIPSSQNFSSIDHTTDTSTLSKRIILLLINNSRI